MEMDLTKAKKAYFLGLGGIGVSAIARMFLLEGKEVFGSDTADTEITQELEKAGAKIFIGQSADNIPADTDLIIYSIALDKFAADFMKEVRMKFKNVISYPEALSIISRDKFTIAIAGTHGKTTTTAMIAKIMMDAGLDPTVIVGSLLSDYKTNFIAGRSKYLVVEACEYCRSFLNIHPTILVITSIDSDHLDYYKDFEDIKNAFKEFRSKLSGEGVIVGDQSDSVVKEISESAPKIVDSSSFYDSSLHLQIPGNHNKRNASVALAVALELGIQIDDAKKSLSNFGGTWRRFEYKGETKEGARVYDDYAHHPEEIKATLQGAREIAGEGKIYMIFEPHLFSRTKLLLNEFAECFKDVDEVVLTPIYPAREEFDPSISSEMLAGKISNTKAQYEDSFQSASDYVTNKAKKGDIILVTGAGDITNITKLLLS
ncbi:MAG TPA: UDP-N-acetylmuramate--L-alanine ligase [Candidatus Paceibacterota bacterium]|nr:UDP-N-acetylmuramate--L-alanine ligase [Candidatus Paceibacterota bacterium]